MTVCKYCEGSELDKKSSLFNHAYSSTDGVIRWTRILLYSGRNMISSYYFKENENE